MKTPSASRTVIANAIAYLASIAVSFIQAPFVIHQLGDERYGLWTLICLVTGYYGLLDLGTRGAIGFFVARARARNDAQEIAEITASAFWFLAAAGAVVLVVGSVVLAFFPHLFHVPEIWRRQSVIALALALAITVLTLPLDVFAAIVNGCRRGELIMLSETGIRILTAIAIFAIFPYVARLDVLAGIQVGGKLISWVVSFTIARLFDQSWSVDPRFWRIGRFREIMHYGLQSFVINVASVFVERLDTIIIGVVLGARMVTFYVIGQSLVGYVAQGINSITLALTPFFADLSAKDEAGGSLRLFFTGTRAATLATGVLAGGILVFGRAFLANWVGPNYVVGDWHSRSDVVLLVLLLATVPRLLLSAGYQYLFGSNKQGFLSRLLVIEGVANLAVSLLLVRPLGLVGIAVGTLIPSLISHCWYVPHYVAKSLGIPVRRLFLHGQARGLAAGALVAAIGFAMSRLITPDNWPRFFAAVIVTIAVASPLLWFYGITATDRSIVHAILDRKRAAQALPVG